MINLPVHITKARHTLEDQCIHLHAFHSQTQQAFCCFQSEGTFLRGNRKQCIKLHSNRMGKQKANFKIIIKKTLLIQTNWNWELFELTEIKENKGNFIYKNHCWISREMIKFLVSSLVEVYTWSPILLLYCSISY